MQLHIFDNLNQITLICIAHITALQYAMQLLLRVLVELYKIGLLGYLQHVELLTNAVFKLVEKLHECEKGREFVLHNMTP